MLVTFMVSQVNVKSLCTLQYFEPLVPMWDLMGGKLKENIWKDRGCLGLENVDTGGINHKCEKFSTHFPVHVHVHVCNLHLAPFD